MRLVADLLMCVGSVVVATCVSLVLREAIRAVRQGLRVAAVATRIYSRRRPSLKEDWFAIKREFCRSYSSLIIGFVEIPHDPSKPLRARLPR